MSTRLYSIDARRAAFTDARLGTPKNGTRLARLTSMRTLASLAPRIALIAAASGGVVAACYNDVPGPSGPLPPTREVSPQGPRPGPIMPAPVVTFDAGIAPMHEPTTSRVIETQVKLAPQAQNPTPPTTPQPSPVDAGVGDVLDLPPIPDSSVPLDAPGVKK
jgi:hypothetical protein